MLSFIKVALVTESHYINNNLIETILRLKGPYIALRRHLFNHVHCCSTHNIQEVEIVYLSMDEWIKKMWSIYTMIITHLLKNMKFTAK